MPGLVQRARERRDARVAPGLHFDRTRAPGRRRLRRDLMAAIAGLEALAVVDVLDQGQQQRGAVGEVQVQRLTGDPGRAGDVGHRQHGVRVGLDEAAGRFENSLPRT